MKAFAWFAVAMLCVSLPAHAQSAPKEVATLTSPAEPWSVVVAKNGRVAAAVCADHQLRVWNVPDATALPSIDLGQRNIYTMTISPDGRTVVAGDYAGEYSFWETATGKERAHLSLRFYPYTIAFSPDGSRLAIAPVGEPVQVYDVLAARKLFELSQRPVGGTGVVAFSRDNSRLVAADTDTVVRIYDARTGELLTTNTDFMLEPLAATFSADGKQLFTGGGDKLVATLDVASGKATRKSGKLDDPVGSLDLSPDGAWVSALLMHADNLTMPAPIIVSEAVSGRRVSQWLPPSVTLWSGWTIDGRLLLATGDARAVHIWHVR